MVHFSFFYGLLLTKKKTLCEAYTCNNWKAQYPEKDLLKLQQITLEWSNYSQIPQGSDRDVYMHCTFGKLYRNKNKFQTR